MPISVYLSHHLDLLDRLSKGPISADDIKAMRARTDELSSLLLELDKDDE